MPETITAYNTFVGGTKARASEANTNFSNHRGTSLPIDPTIAAASHQAYDLGVSTHEWRNLFLTNLPFINGTQLTDPGLAGGMTFKINGPLDGLELPARRQDGGVLTSQGTFTKAILTLEVPGNAGTLEVDARRYDTTNVVVTSVIRQFSGTVDSISKAGTTHTTQSITRTATNLSTDSISRFKPQLTVQSILPTFDGLTRYNIDTLLGSDFSVGDSMLVASADTSTNNGTFNVVRINDDGRPNVVLDNGSGEAQAGTAGTIDLNAFSYNVDTSIPADWVAGESAIFTSHITSTNNGTFTMFEVSGSALAIKNSSGEVQATTAGSINIVRFSYNFALSVTADYTVGEQIFAAAHSASANNGNFVITAVNNGGDNIQVVNTGGVLQVGALGNVQTERWIYALQTNPSSQFAVGESLIVVDASSTANNGHFTVAEINRSASNNIVVFNVDGIASGASSGGLSHSKLIYNLQTTMSTVYTTTSSRVRFEGLLNASNNGEFDVTAIDYSSGTNLVVINTLGGDQVAESGRIVHESKSLFTTRPTLTFSLDFSASGQHLKSDVGAVFDAVTAIVAANTYIGIDVMGLPTGKPSDMVLQIL